MDRLQDHFLRPTERAALEALLRERKAASLRVRRGNALLLLDDGLAPIDVARVLYLDEETIRSWKRSFENDGLGSLDLNAYSKRDGHLMEDQEAQLAALFRTRPAKTTDEVRAVIAKRFDVTYSRSRAIKLMGRLGFCYKKPKALPMGADEAAQIAHIKAYEALLNGLEGDESVVFADAVHPEYQSRPAPWLERADCKIRLHFLPPYAPHLNPIERLSGIMHGHITHNRYYPTFAGFVDAVIGFFRNRVTNNAHEWRNTITHNFRIISQKNYQLIG